MKATCAAVLAVSLASSGGGGGGDSTTAPASSTPQATAPTGDFAVGVAWATLLTSGGLWSASGAGSDGASYTFDISASHVGSGTLAGAAVDRSNIAVVTKRTGTTVSSAVTGIVFSPATRETLRTTYSNSDCGIPSASSTPPSAAKIGASGPLFQTDDYYQCGFLPAGYTTATWSLEWTGRVPVLCINTNAINRAGQTTFQAICVEVTQAGKLGATSRLTYRDNALTVSPN